jgi:hypothetical protein
MQQKRIHRVKNIPFFEEYEYDIQNHPPITKLHPETV